MGKGLDGVASQEKINFLSRWRVENGDPRDPPVLKILRRVNVGAGRKFGTDVAKRYGEGSEMLVFLGEKRQENGTDSEKLRR